MSEDRKAGMTHWEGCWKHQGHHECAIERIAAMEEKRSDGDCFICGELTNSLAGNPLAWSMWLPFSGGNGATRVYHLGCVVNAIAERGYDPAEALADKEAEVQSLKQQRAQLELLARNPEWMLASDDMTAERHAETGGAFFDREGNVHRIGEQEPEGECWLWVVPREERLG